MTGRVSVVITAHNAARTLSPCLDSLNTQPGCATGGLEVIVVDDRSTDNTSGIARRAGISCLTVVRLSDYSDRSLTARQVALVAGI